LKAALGRKRPRRSARVATIGQPVRRPATRSALAGSARAAARALLLHQLLEVTRYGQPLLRQQLARHLVGKAICVVQAEDLRGGHRGAARVARLLDVQPQRGEALRERAPEALLFS